MDKELRRKLLLDGTMKEVKATNSVELAKYAVENRTDDEPAFDWWVKPALWHRKRLIKLSQKRHSVMGYKFGIRVPCTIEEALKLDEENGNDLWRKAIQCEMEKVHVAFQLLERGAAPPHQDGFHKEGKTGSRWTYDRDSNCIYLFLCG